MLPAGHDDGLSLLPAFELAAGVSFELAQGVGAEVDQSMAFEPSMATDTTLMVFAHLGQDWAPCGQLQMTEEGPSFSSFSCN